MNTPIPAPSFSKTVTRLVLACAGFFALAVIALRVYIGNDAQPWMGEWFVGPDAYMRMVRVWEWWQAGSWYDTVSARSNWPDGEVLHWTRPLDVALLTLASPFWPFVGLHKALFYAGVIVSPVMALMSMWILLRGTRDLLDLRGQAMLLVLFSFQPITRAYFLAARPDHHALILLAFCMVLALLLHYAFDPDNRRNAPAWTGVAAAFGLWVSIESLTTELFALAALALPWLITGDQRWLAGLRRFSVAGALALAVMMGIERPPSEWLSSEEYDRLSTVHVVLLAAIALGIEYMWRARERAETWTVRSIHSAVAAVAAGALMALVFSDFFKGPFGAAMDQRLDILWLGKIQELQPLIAADWKTAVGAAQVLGPSVWLGLWAWQRHRERRPGATFDETMLVLVLAGALYLPLSMFQLRWGAYLGVTVSIAWAVLFQRLLDWRGGPMVGSAPGTPILRVPAVLGLVVTHLAVSALFSTFVPENTPAEDEPKNCKWRELAPVLNGETFANGAPKIILSHIHQGPEILYRTEHRVIGSPYHRNTDGILDAYTAMTTTNEAEARTILARRKVDYVILCVDSGEEKHILKVEGDTVVRKIVNQALPAWLQKVALPDGLEDDFRVFRFVSPGS